MIKREPLPKVRNGPRSFPKGGRDSVHFHASPLTNALPPDFRGLGWRGGRWAKGPPGHRTVPNVLFFLGCNSTRGPPSIWPKLLAGPGCPSSPKPGPRKAGPFIGMRKGLRVAGHYGGRCEFIFHPTECSSKPPSIGPPKKAPQFDHPNGLAQLCNSVEHWPRQQPPLPVTLSPLEGKTGGSVRHEDRGGAP